jgi:hypothetical protein
MPTSVLTQALLLSTPFQDHKSLFETQHASFHAGTFGKQQSHLTYLYSPQYPGLLKENEQILIEKICTCRPKTLFTQPLLYANLLYTLLN